MISKALRQAVVLGGVRQAVQVQAQRTCYPYSHRLVVTPPRKRFPFPEKVLWGLVMATTILSVPAWIMTHIDQYGGGGDKGDEE